MNENHKLSTPGLRLKAFLTDLAVLSYRYGVIISDTRHNGVWVLPPNARMINYQIRPEKIGKSESIEMYVQITEPIKEVDPSDEAVVDESIFRTLEEALACSTGVGGLWIQSNHFILVPVDAIADLRRQGAMVLRLESGTIQSDPVQAVHLNG